ncbi:SMI1/KNR4 family protein [Cystobacter ferrugineus]|uniref:Knr4/Smi1-like domain-containing protein n=1 Tax=Cystobacter ferrugineus TaxID=83449 RepID=A0A1L9BJ14_9BACT|nr:SMI1/KNR4 family protein [Cystobacter ferrugineus]OJH42243.1 hypothetical protein BON30_03260 [Cystobacter ferrugineus]
MKEHIRALLEYISRYDPEFTNAIGGASREQIEQLESILARPLPSVHRGFLECMGQSVGKLIFYEGVMDPTIESLLEYYTEERWHPPYREYVLFAIDTGPQGSDLFLDCRESANNPAVIRGEPALDFPARARLKHASLSDALFSAALTSIRMPLLPCRASLYATTGWTDRFEGKGLQLLKDICLKLGFERLPFGAEWSPSYERGDAVIDAYEAPGFLPSFEIAASNQREVDRLAEILKDNLGLVRLR